MTLLQDPIFNPDYITFVLDGSIHPSYSLLEQDTLETNNNGVEDKFPRLPIFVANPEQPVQVQFLSLIHI